MPSQIDITELPNDDDDASGSGGRGSGGGSGSGSSSRASSRRSKTARKRTSRPRPSDGQLSDRLAGMLERLTTTLRERGDDELAEAVERDGAVMANALVNITKPVKWLRIPLIAIIGIVEPGLAFGRTGRIVASRWAARRARTAPGGQPGEPGVQCNRCGQVSSVTDTACPFCGFPGTDTRRP